MEIESVESPSGNLLIKGVVEGGGHFIATLGPTTLNVFLQSSNGTMRFSGANYTGELSALQMTNLADDVRLRVPAKMEQLESAIESPIQ